MQEDFTFAITITSCGSFSWTSGPRAGSCTLDNTITADLSLEDYGGSSEWPVRSIEV